MFARRISAVLAIVVGIVLLASLVGSMIYGTGFELGDLVTVASILVLLLGAALAFWRKTITYLIMAWAWMAGVHVPRLLRATPPPPAYLNQHANNPQVEAMLRRGWEFSLHWNEYVALAFSVVAIAGLCLGLFGEKLGRNPQSSDMEA